MSDLAKHAKAQPIAARDEKIDILRFVGLAMIILAHSDPSLIIGQLRNFDVPLMVLVSGASFLLSYKSESYFAYIWKRVKRLVFPTWIFLTFYFSVIFLTHFPIAPPTIKAVISTYVLLFGIGYVWIIRVFLLVAMISPFILVLNQKLKSNTVFFLLALAVYTIYEVILFFIKIYPDSQIKMLFENTVLYVLPYSIVFAIGIRLAQMTRQHIIVFMLAMFTLFLGVGAFLWIKMGTLMLTQEFKYPPAIYYLSYALFMSLFLWLTSDVLLKGIRALGFYSPIMFVAQNTIWIYLWHIPLIEIVNLPFYIKYPIVFTVASLLVYAQVQTVKKLIIPQLSSQSSIRNIKYLFTG